MTLANRSLFVEDQEVLAITVYGTPRPAGSKRVVPVGKKGGPKRFIVTDASRKSRPWKEDVSREAARVMAGRELIRGALDVTFRFYVARPKGHFGKRGLLASARPYPTVRPDALKLARAVEDSLSGIVYHDDAQIVKERLVKEYGAPERVEIEIRELA